ncbi:protein YgfX [Salinisphaera sp.]|uniref:protein YgfX n=1 Tax=Salinisphaera sp. TaxID=1914330 RepID=UPI000C47B36C|nr:protein YgfX [Salinisphaera sp.]MBS62791.1 hypothetical protein [Salinisphaera sp.]
MANPFADTLHLNVRVSAAHRAFVLALHIAAAAVIGVLSAGRPWLLGLLPVIAVLARHAHRNAVLERADSIVRLRYQYDGHWRWQRRDGVWQRGHLVSAFTAGDWLMVLRLRAEGDRLRSRSCILFRDALSARAHRRLRARLTIAPPRGGAEQA